MFCNLKNKPSLGPNNQHFVWTLNLEWSVDNNQKLNKTDFEITLNFSQLGLKRARNSPKLQTKGFWKVFWKWLGIIFLKKILHFGKLFFSTYALKYSKLIELHIFLVSSISWRNWQIIFIFVMRNWGSLFWFNVLRHPLHM